MNLRRITRDHLALPNAFLAPVTPTQIALCDSYAIALMLDRVGCDDDFFDLGGDSLGAERLSLAALEAGLPAFPAVKLFTLGTPRRLADWLEARQTAAIATPAADAASMPASSAMDAAPK